MVNQISLCPSIFSFSNGPTRLRAYFTEYEIVAPYEVDRHGRYVSHAVAHHHRRKRALEAHAIDPASTAHFHLHGLGQDFHMDLRPSVGLVAPGFTVQTLGGNGTQELETLPGEDFCFYQGSLRSKGNSTVALATCAGMVSRRDFPGSGRITTGVQA